MHTALRITGRCLAGALFVAALAACGADTADQLNEYGNPLRVEPRPTSSEISVADLQVRLYAFAHDSMMGRMAGREGNRMGTDYIAREVERMGLEPGGENGTYFQALPFVVRKFSDASALRVNGEALRWNQDFVAVPGNAEPRAIRGVQAVYGGVLGDEGRQIAPRDAADRVVVFNVPDGLAGRQRMLATQPFAAVAAAVVTVDLDGLTMSERAFLNDPAGSLVDPRAAEPEPAAAMIRITSDAAARLLGAPMGEVAVGAAGGTVDADLDFVRRPVPDYARNVIAILRGSDPELANEYVVIGSHNDHTGYTASPVDHDSARAHAMAVYALRTRDGGFRNLTAEQAASVVVNVDSLRRLRPARMDSIRNGADDDGSGSVAMLEIAEALAASPDRPRRSVLFIWHTAEERGLQGSRWFVENPTVPIESMITMLNMDMVGRGRANDVPGGGDDLLFVIGASHLSSELGDVVDEVNRQQDRPLRLDYRLDDDIDWPGYQNLYNRSDHVHYARRDIPIAFFFTGLHHDYHQVTDEPQYIDYVKLARISRYVHDVVLDLANRARRPALDAEPAVAGG